MNKMINISLPLIYSAYNEDIYVISSNKKWKAELVVEWVTYDTRRINVSKMLDAVGISKDNFIKMLLIKPGLLLPIGSNNNYNIIYGSFHTTMILQNVDGGYSSDIILECRRSDVTLSDILSNLTVWLKKSFAITISTVRSKTRILPDNSLIIISEDNKQKIVTMNDIIPTRDRSDIVSNKIKVSELQNIIRIKHARI